jgi:DNA repair protein RadC
MAEINAPGAAQALEALIARTDRTSDAAALARALVSSQGRESRVFELAAEDIRAQTGLGKAACEAIDMIDEISRYAEIEALGEKAKLTDSHRAGEYFMALLRGRHVEYCYLACLDEGKRLTSLTLMGKGTLNAAEVYVRNIAQAALRSGAKYAYLAHNHPGGGLAPSQADIALTRRAGEALALIGTTLLDHIIVTQTAYQAIMEEGRT